MRWSKHSSMMMIPLCSQITVNIWNRTMTSASGLKSSRTRNWTMRSHRTQQDQKEESQVCHSGLCSSDRSSILYLYRLLLLLQKRWNKKTLTLCPKLNQLIPNLESWRVMWKRSHRRNCPPFHVDTDLLVTCRLPLSGNYISNKR